MSEPRRSGDAISDEASIAKPKARRTGAGDALRSSDPLADEVCIGLLHYCEEDDLVDFKEAFDPKSEKCWIDLATDCVAFANTNGGYIVLGVRDKTWNQVGLDATVATGLSDTKKVLEKVNRNLVPVLLGVRTRHFQIEEKHFVVIYVPCSEDCTHIFESNLDWQPEPGKTLTRVSKGAIYVRRSASNQVLTSADFEALLQRRLQHFRRKVLDGVARVVNAPPGHDVVTIVQTSDATGGHAITVSDAPETSGLVGKPLKLASSGIAERLALYRALTDADSKAAVPVHCLFEAYANREIMGLDEATKCWVALHCALEGVPVFYWFKDLKPAQARDTLRQAFNLAAGYRRGYILTYSGFYGQSFYDSLRERMESQGFWGTRAFPGKNALLNAVRSKQVESDAPRATELAQQLMSQRDWTLEHELERLDCSLYAPFD